jgi:hypothetical protein
MKISQSFKIFILASIIACVGAGCKDKSDAPKVRHLKGRVVSIDPESEIVTGSFYIEQQQKEMELSGKLAPDAEIMINGRTATLKDVRIDDSVEVTGYEEKHDGERKLVAQRVEIIRAEPATQPGGAPQQAETAAGGS